MTIEQKIKQYVADFYKLAMKDNPLDHDDFCDNLDGHLDLCEYDSLDELYKFFENIAKTVKMYDSTCIADVFDDYDEPYYLNKFGCKDKITSEFKKFIVDNCFWHLLSTEYTVSN